MWGVCPRPPQGTDWVEVCPRGLISAPAEESEAGRGSTLDWLMPRGEAGGAPLFFLIQIPSSAVRRRTSSNGKGKLGKPQSALDSLNRWPTFKPAQGAARFFIRFLESIPKWSGSCIGEEHVRSHFSPAGNWNHFQNPGAGTWMRSRHRSRPGSELSNLSISRGREIQVMSCQVV